MAWTITRYPDAFGSRRTVGLVIVPDSATFNVETGLSKVEWMMTGISSLTTISSVHIAVNSGTGGTAIAGTLGVSGMTSGDILHVTVFGH